MAISMPMNRWKVKPIEVGTGGTVAILCGLMSRVLRNLCDDSV